MSKTVPIHYLAVNKEFNTSAARTDTKISTLSVVRDVNNVDYNDVIDMVVVGDTIKRAVASLGYYAIRMGWSTWHTDLPEDKLDDLQTLFGLLADSDITLVLSR